MNTILNLSTGIEQSSFDVKEGHDFDLLLYTVFQKPRESDSGGIVVAISSANPGEGVTYAARALIQELGKCELSSVAGVNMSFLRKLHEPTLEAIKSSLHATERGSGGESHAISNRKRMGPAVAEYRNGPWEGSWQYRRDCIELLRSEFDYSIIDCPSLKASGDLLSIAPFVDGVLLVIEANHTRRSDPRVAEQGIAAAGGNLLGFILNKRTYQLPMWLDRML